MGEKMKKAILAVFVIGMFVFATGFALAVNGASTVTEENTGRMASPNPDNHAAIAGNVTELSIVSDSVTQTWQGYYGNVSGTIQLADGSSNVMYNWSATNPTGEVLASVNSTVDWASIACATIPNMNTLETQYNIEADAVDGVTETFSLGTGGNHNIAGTALNNCPSINVFNDTGASGSNFEEILLWDGDAAVFAAILEQDALGFDGNSHDFEMLVLEDGHGTDTDTTDYYFYVELA